MRPACESKKSSLQDAAASEFCSSFCQRFTERVSALAEDELDSTLSSKIVALAWADEVPFDAIQYQYGLSKRSYSTHEASVKNHPSDFGEASVLSQK